MAQKIEDLKVWQRAIQLSVAVYRLTESFPKTRDVWLVFTITASRSFCGKQHCGRPRSPDKGEFRQFLGIAQGSNYEVQTQLFIAKELGLGSQDRLHAAQQLNAEVGKMLTAFIATVSGKLEARS